MGVTNILDLNNRIDALEKSFHELKIWTTAEAKSVSGNPITLTDGSARKAEGLSVTCNPKQNLHGYDHPWAGGAGKNKLPMTVSSIKSANTSGTWNGNNYTINDITFKLNTDADGNIISISASGTASAVAALKFSTSYVSNIYNGMLVNGAINGSNSTHFINVVYSLNGTSWASETPQTGTDVTVSSSYDWVRFEADVANGANVNTTFYPMIRLASESDATFEPYSNICPITGLTECVVDVCTLEDEEEITQNTATITFGQTVYGGSVDFKTGKVTVTHGLVDLGTLDYTAQTNISSFYARLSDAVTGTTGNVMNAICSQYKAVQTKGSVADMMSQGDGIFAMQNGSKLLFIKDTGKANLTASQFADAMDGVQLCYELATPTELTLTPAELELLKGYNYITTNGTTIALDYLPDSLKADILLTVSQLYGSKISIFDEILAGGDTGQVLTKTSDDNYDATWATLPTTRTTNKK